MSFIAVIFISAIMSADAWIFGLSFGAKGIKINIFSILIITLTGLGILMVSSFLGEILSNFVIYGRIVGSFILIGTGMWLCSDDDENIKGVLDNPERADMNKSKTIDPFEALITGFVLSIDSAAVILGSALAEGSEKVLPFFILVFQIVFIFAGIRAGRSRFKNISGKTISILAGFVIVLMGLYKLSAVFY